jgi:hypothetical protein
LLARYREVLAEDLSAGNLSPEPAADCRSSPHPPDLFPITSDDCESEPNASDRLSLDRPAVYVRKKRGPAKRDSLTDPSITSDGDGSTFIKRRLFESMHILTIDIGATRTKFMYQFGSTNRLLTTLDSRDLWVCPEGTTSLQASKLFRRRLGNHLEKEEIPIDLTCIDAVIFSVPGTVDLTGEDEEDMCVVRNMPSLSPSLKGFNFKRGFADVFPNAKIYAVADNMAAAMGVASSTTFRNTKCGLVLVLGTAPAVATFFRAPHVDEEKKKFPSKTVELAIWQSWVWFTKIPLTDRFGYCGGLQTDEKGGFKLRATTEYKIPHSKARIRFAIDSLTWKRLRGRLDWLSRDLQGHLSKEEARDVWSGRVQASVDALCLKFHQVYGKPDIVVLLGGNALKCTNRISVAKYTDPDFSRSEPLQVPIYVPSSDEEQQLIHMRGLAQAANYKISQVHAHGPDPLARGWTRGGEIYLWVKRRDIL